MASSVWTFFTDTHPYKETESSQERSNISAFINYSWASFFEIPWGKTSVLQGIQSIILFREAFLSATDCFCSRSAWRINEWVQNLKWLEKILDLYIFIYIVEQYKVLHVNIFHILLNILPIKNYQKAYYSYAPRYFPLVRHNIKIFCNYLGLHWVMHDSISVFCTNLIVGQNNWLTFRVK